MSKEGLAEFKNHVSQTIQVKSMDVIETIAGKPWVKKTMRGVSPYVIERGMELFSYNGLEDTIEQTRPYLQSGHKLVILASHKSHGEIAPGIHIMEEFMRECPEFLDQMVFPVSKSMSGGEQGNIIKTLYEDVLVPNLRSRNIRPLSVTTDNDVKRRGYKRNKMANGLAVGRALKRDGTGFFVFIEGTVEGGRKNKQTGEINGLQEPDSMLQQLLEYSKASCAPLVFVTAGIANSHNLLSADGKFVTPLWGRAMIENELGFGNTYAQVNMGKPISTLNLNLDNIPQARDNLMISLASSIPHKERGMYKGVEYLLST